MPSAGEVRQVFAGLESGDADSFFRHVADDVDWTVEGTHPLAGRYRDKQEFRERTFARLGRLMQGPLILQVEQVLVDGDRAAVELRSVATARNGMTFDNRYCWVLRFAGGRIAEVRAYLDSALVQRLIDENE